MTAGLPCRSRHARSSSKAGKIVLAALACSLIVVPVARAAHPVSPARTGRATIHRLCRAPAPGHAACTALQRVPVAASSAAGVGASTYTLNDGASSSGLAGGLTPAQLASAYGYEGAGGGSGQTVAIVDAYDDPAIEEDLATFDTHYGLSACTTANGCFEKVGQTGSQSKLPAADESGWSVEISLDVETVHSVCENCKILLVEANEPSFADLADAVNEAVSLGATEVSNSYSGPETDIKATERAAYNHLGVVIAAATGDDGYDDWDVINQHGRGAEMPDAPASLPSVVAVGGTSLYLNSNGTRSSETVWNKNGPGDKTGLADKLALGATGGGCSTLFTAPAWQQSAAGFAESGCGSKRLAADVSAVADPDTGFDIYDTYNCGEECELFGIGQGSGWLTIGGTSLATPLISAVYGLAGGSGGVSYPAQTLYTRLAENPSSLFDVSQGGNGFCGSEPAAECDSPKAPNSRYGHVDCEGTTACNAAHGLDGPSGVGSPNGLGAFEPPSPAEEEAAAAKRKHEEELAAAVSAEEATTARLTEEAAAAIKKLEEETSRLTAGAAAAFHSAVPAPVPDAGLASTALSASSTGDVSVKITCPAAETSCKGTVTLRALGAVNAGSAGVAKTTATALTLAKGQFTIPGGRVKTVTLRLSVKARTLLAHSHRLRVRVTILARDPAGASHTAVAIATLREAVTKHGKG